MKKYLLPTIIALSALSVSISAAFYSVTGLSMLFAGASLAVLIMASSLEVAKLVIASLLYQYWNDLNKILRIYLTIAACILVLITSAGIYGFLSAAYQETATKSEIVDKQIIALETKKQLYIDSRDNILKEKQSLADLRGTLSKGSTTQYTDKKGNLVVKTNNAAIRNIESASKSDEKLSTKIDVVNDSIFSLENQILQVKTNSEVTSELGPLKYISNLTGQSMDKIINWFLLVIIFVFDPLAISLVIAANFAFAQIRPKKEYPLEEQVDDMRKIVETYDDLEDEIKEWEEASLTDFQENQYWEDDNIGLDKYGNPTPIFEDEEPNEKLKQAAEKYKKQTGIPVMVDPKTGKLFYEEPDPEPVNLDLNGDGIVEEEELQQVFEQADTNNDGFIDEEEAKIANLDKETTEALNKLNQSTENIIEDVKQYYNLNSEEIETLNNRINEIKKLSVELSNLKNKKDDDNTITYF
jgi:hypothetical protein